MDYIPVIDAHTHIFPDAIAAKARHSLRDFYNLGVYTVGTMDEHKKIFNEKEIDGKTYRIVKALVSSPASTPKQVESINNFIAGLCKENPHFVGFGTIHRDYENVEEELDRILDLGLVGVKIHHDFQDIDNDDPKYIEIYKKIAARGLPILFHMGDETYTHTTPEKLTAAMEAVPNLVAISSHLGGYLYYEEALAQPIFENLYFDISSAYAFTTHEMFHRMVNRFGEDHFFFGSDFPMWEPYDEIKRINTIGFSEETLEKIYHKNFENFCKKHLPHSKK